ncbi:MAG: hypothetical protein CSB13_08285 [Chloroflexi bacterium]|nr:MAG: hypothetical protein CSB13_08285 [Chloroflexota bacterium]
MSKIPTSRLLGIALIAGATIVGIIIMILMSNYAQTGTFASSEAILFVIIAFLLLVLPQISLGLYLIWKSP